MNENEDNTSFGDSDFLSMNDKAIRDFRSSGKHVNHKIIEKMITLRHNMKYNRHLVSVYMKAKELFDTMVEEHRSQIQSLDEIYRHINHLIRENLSEQRIRSKKMHGRRRRRRRYSMNFIKIRNGYTLYLNE